MLPTWTRVGIEPGTRSGNVLNHTAHPLSITTAAVCGTQFGFIPVKELGF